MAEAELADLTRQLEQRIEHKSLILPMLPAVTNQVLALVNDPESDAAALAKLVQSDQALAGHAMRIANSAAYSPNIKLSSLQQAIARLGMQIIAEIAMAATMGPKLFVAPGFENVIKQLWENSLSVAVWAREIARQGRRSVESTFLCGLLFQIGRPVVLQTVLDIGKKADQSVSPEQVINLMKNYQVQVGLQLASHWELPPAVIHTIGSIYAKQISGDVEVVETVRAARVFAAHMGGKINQEKLISHSAVVGINLYDTDVAELLEKSDAVKETIGALSL